VHSAIELIGHVTSSSNPQSALHMLFPAGANVERLADITATVLSGNLVDTSNLIGAQLFAEFLEGLLIVFCPYKFTKSLKST